jgi:hypothetical protein
MVSIWFFIGISLLVNGMLILGAGLYEWQNPPAHPEIVLFKLHAGVWWGALMTVTGAVYCYYFKPGQKKT